MAEHEIPLEQLRRELNEVTKRLNEVQNHVLVGNRDTTELKSEINYLKATIQDTNKESHTTKHDILNIKNNMGGLVEVLKNTNESFKKNDEILRLVREDLLSTQVDKRLKRLESFMDEMLDVANIDGFKNMAKEIAKNTEFRTKLGAFWIFITALGAIAGILYGIIELIEKLPSASPH